MFFRLGHNYKDNSFNFVLKEHILYYFLIIIKNIQKNKENSILEFKSAFSDLYILYVINVNYNKD